MTAIYLETCVDDAPGFAAAVAGGSDRIELCARLDLGGLTPDADMLALVADCPVPVRAMIRLRGGGFVLTPEDCDLMIRQIEQVRRAGCAGVVIGAATPEGALDLPALAQLVGAAEGMAITLHRVTDILADPVSAVGVAESLGIDTILTSGGAPDAHEGVPTIAQMIAASQRVTVMPGAGIGPANAGDIVRATGATWLHGSFRDATGQTSAAVIRQVRQVAAARRP